MHIEALFLNTYSQSQPLTGHMDVKNSDGSLVRIVFNDEECAVFQQLAVAAFERGAKVLAEKITAETPRLLELPAPSPLDDEDIPF